MVHLISALTESIQLFSLVNVALDLLVFIFISTLYYPDCVTWQHCVHFSPSMYCFCSILSGSSLSWLHAECYLPHLLQVEKAINIATLRESPVPANILPEIFGCQNLKSVTQIQSLWITDGLLYHLTRLMTSSLFRLMC